LVSDLREVADWLGSFHSDALYPKSCVNHSSEVAKGTNLSATDDTNR